MLVPSTCNAVTHVLSRVSCGLGVHAPLGTWALQDTGLVVALSVVPPDGSVVAVALAWLVVGNVVALKVLAVPVLCVVEVFGLSGFMRILIFILPLFLTVTFYKQRP